MDSQNDTHTISCSKQEWEHFQSFLKEKQEILERVKSIEKAKNYLQKILDLQNDIAKNWRTFHELLKQIYSKSHLLYPLFAEEHIIIDKLIQQCHILVRNKTYIQSLLQLKNFQLFYQYIRKYMWLLQKSTKQHVFELNNAFYFKGSVYTLVSEFESNGFLEFIGTLAKNFKVSFATKIQHEKEEQIDMTESYLANETSIIIDLDMNQVQNIKSCCCDVVNKHTRNLSIYNIEMVELLYSDEYYFTKLNEKSFQFYCKKIIFLDDNCCEVQRLEIEKIQDSDLLFTTVHSISCVIDSVQILLSIFNKKVTNVEQFAKLLIEQQKQKQKDGMHNHKEKRRIELTYIG